MLDERLRFQKMVKERLELNDDLRRGLRESILANQVLKSLAYIELLFDEMDAKISDAPKTESTAAPKTTSKRKTTTKKSDEETAETTSDENKD